MRDDSEVSVNGLIIFPWKWLDKTTGMIMSNTAPLQKSSQWPETSDHHYELEVEVGCKGAFINTDRGRLNGKPYEICQLAV